MMVKDLKIGESYLIESPNGSVIHEIAVIDIATDLNPVLIKFTSPTINRGAPNWRKVFSVGTSTFLSLEDTPRSFRFIVNGGSKNTSNWEDTIHA